MFFIKNINYYTMFITELILICYLYGYADFSNQQDNGRRKISRFGTNIFTSLRDEHLYIMKLTR